MTHFDQLNSFFKTNSDHPKMNIETDIPSIEASLWKAKNTFTYGPARAGGDRPYGVNQIIDHRCFVILRQFLDQ